MSHQKHNLFNINFDIIQSIIDRQPLCVCVTFLLTAFRTLFTNSLKAEMSQSSFDSFATLPMLIYSGI